MLDFEKLHTWLGSLEVLKSLSASLHCRSVHSATLSSDSTTHSSLPAHSTTEEEDEEYANEDWSDGDYGQVNVPSKRQRSTRTSVTQRQRQPQQQRQSAVPSPHTSIPQWMYDSQQLQHAPPMPPPPSCMPTDSRQPFPFPLPPGMTLTTADPTYAHPHASAAAAPYLLSGQPPHLLPQPQSLAQAQTQQQPGLPHTHRAPALTDITNHPHAHSHPYPNETYASIKLVAPKHTQDTLKSLGLLGGLSGLGAGGQHAPCFAADATNQALPLSLNQDRSPIKQQQQQLGGGLGGSYDPNVMQTQPQPSSVTPGYHTQHQAHIFATNSPAMGSCRKAWNHAAQHTPFLSPGLPSGMCACACVCVC